MSCEVTSWWEEVRRSQQVSIVTTKCCRPLERPRLRIEPLSPMLSRATEQFLPADDAATNFVLQSCPPNILHGVSLPRPANSSSTAAGRGYVRNAVHRCAWEQVECKVQHFRDRPCLRPKYTSLRVIYRYDRVCQSTSRCGVGANTFCLRRRPAILAHPSALTRTLTALDLISTSLGAFTCS